MKANKKTLMAVKKFLDEEQEFWDIEEFKNDLVVKTNLLKHIDDYTQEFIEGICNVLDSFIGEDISCYFEDEDD